MPKTVIVDLYGGPGSGKTTTAWEIASGLKKMGYEVEIAAEVAKEIIYDGDEYLLDGSIANQREVFSIQKHREERLFGKVDFVVTDSPTLMQTVYVEEGKLTGSQAYQAFKKDVKSYWTERDAKTFSALIEREGAYHQEGRVHTEDEAVNIDHELLRMLQKENVYYGVYSHAKSGILLLNMVRTFISCNGSEYGKEK